MCNEKIYSYHKKAFFTRFSEFIYTFSYFNYILITVKGRKIILEVNTTFFLHTLNFFSAFTVPTSKWNNFFSLDFFTHKANLFLNQNEIPRRMMYDMTTFGKTAQATNFYALMGVFTPIWHAPNDDSKFFWTPMVHLVIIKSQSFRAMTCTREVPQRLD